MTESSPRIPNQTPDPVIFQLTVGTLTRAMQMLRRALGWFTLAYLAGLLIAMVALEWWGERLWIFSLLLYAPAQMLLLPLLVLAPLCLLARPRLCLWHLAGVLVFALGYMTFRWSGSSRRDEKMITAVTFNMGQSNRPQFAEFIAREKPDVILLQDARGRGPEFATKLLGAYVSGQDQFVLISRFPIRKSELLLEPNWAGRAVAARFEVTLNDRPLVLYNVHLPTPRQELSRFIGGRRILGDLVGRSRREPGFGNYREWIAQRVGLARALAQVFRDERQSFIVAGDFNTPDHGSIYHLFAAEMKDAFTLAGRGWGLTFPGTTHNPIAGFGPWLRLDYFFTGRGWQAVECRPESGNKSQHKALLCRLEPTPEK